MHRGGVCVCVCAQACLGFRVQPGIQSNHLSAVPWLLQ